MTRKKQTKAKPKRKAAKCRKSVAKKRKPPAKKKRKPAAKKKGKAAAKKKATASPSDKDKPGKGSTGPKYVDWAAAKRKYTTSNRYINHEELAERYLVDKDGNHVQCNVSVVHRRSAKEGWSKGRRDYIIKNTADFLDLIGERYVLTKKDNLDNLGRMKELLLETLLTGKVEKVAVSDVLSIMKHELTYFGEADFTVNVPESNKQAGVEHVKKALLSALKSKKLTRAQLRKAVAK